MDEAWLRCVVKVAAAGEAAAATLYGTAQGRRELGAGAGGDGTLAVDLACERAMREVLQREAPAPFLLVSEEAGIVGDEQAPYRVVMDPLDGSHNAQRGLEPFCGSIAVAEGPKLRDVRVAHIKDYTRPHAYSAVAGVGLLSPDLRPDRFSRRAVELVLIEVGRPDRQHFRYHDLSALGAVGRSRNLRIRQIGSLALALCHVALGTADVLLAAVRSRSVDIAAGLRVLKECGGEAVTLRGDDLFEQPLDLVRREAFLAWRAGFSGEELLLRTRELRETLASGLRGVDFG